MYQLAGKEFGDLVTREFTAGPVTAEASGSLKDVFSCKSQNTRTKDFDILNFTASFQEETRVNHFQDTTHVSMHFQQSGRSGASISGLAKGQPIKGGQFNVLNCIDPVSSFVFPKQTHYAYTCIGLEPAFFNVVLDECGTAYQNLLAKSRKREAFTLFSSGAAISHFQLSALQLLQNPPLADNLKTSYTRSKVKELILLSLHAYSTTGDRPKETIPAAEIEKLRAVREYLTQHFLTALTLEGISRTFLLNEFKLKKGFKSLFGSTVFGYIHELRMQHAHALMHAGGLSVGEIAGITGYHSDSSFIRAFKTFHGSAPAKLFHLIT
jgi:AraC family transcriptional activator of pyochelin receptor